MVPCVGKGTTRNWYGILKELDCKVSSTWSVCGNGRAEVFTHRHLSEGNKAEISQMDYL